VIHVLDASRAVGVASQLLSDTQAEPFIAATKADYQHMRDLREGKEASALLSLADARANGFVADMSEKAPPPEQPGLHTFADWDLADLAECFDWTPSLMTQWWVSRPARSTPMPAPCSTRSLPRSGSRPRASAVSGPARAMATM
jgi:cobalamin-dependent methionine synthase I